MTETLCTPGISGLQDGIYIMDDLETFVVKGREMYADPSIQKAYRAMRKQGLTVSDAQQTVKLMTGDVPVQTSISWKESNRYLKPTSMPFYHEQKKRRF